MSDFNYENFDKLYKEKILPKLEPFEKQRKKTLLICGIIIFIGILLIGAVFFNSIYYKDLNLKIDLKSICTVIVIASILCTGIIENFRTKLKTTFYKNLFASIEFKHITSSLKHETKIKKICKESDIFSRYDYVNVDDVITGEYNSLPFAAIDTYVYYETTDSKGNTTEHTVFQGIVIQTKINKPLKCDILIKKDGWLQSKKIGKKETVRLESIEFEKMFEVYADDQIEARYILTPSFMERLMNYTKKRKGKAVEAFLSNKISEENNVFFFLHTNKDNFEVPLMKPLTDKKVFYDILKELTDALDVISELKLEQNIGL